MENQTIRLTPRVSFPKPIVKLFLYKVARGSELWHFNHDFANIPTTAAAAQLEATPYVATGGDPADMDLPSKTVLAGLSNLNLGRMPFDSWIPRKLGIKTEQQTGTPTTAGVVNDEQIQAYYKLEDMDRRNILLNWKNLYGTDFRNNFYTFFSNRKAELQKQLADIVKVFEQDKRKALNRYDLTDFLIKYTHSTTITEFGNILDMELASDPNAFFASGTAVHLSSSAGMGSFQSEDNGKTITNERVVGNEPNVTIPLIEENDIIELRVKYLDTDNGSWEIQESGFVDSDGYRRVFIGYVSSLVRTTQYNNQERVNVAASGASKLFSLYDTSFVPSIVLNGPGATGTNQFEAGIEMRDTQYSIWANRFNGMSADTIFDNFMRSGLFCQKIGEAYAPAIRDEIKALKQELYVIEQGQDGTDPAYKPQKPEDKLKLENRKKELPKLIAQKQARLDEINSQVLRNLFKQKNFPSTLPDPVLPPQDLDIEYYLPISQQDPSAISFQLINFIPVLMGLARTYALEDAIPAVVDGVEYNAALPDTMRIATLSQVMATAEQAGYLAYKTMMQTAFKMYYPELKRPDAVFQEIKENTFLEIFEDRPGVVRIRPPKYNIINLNPEVSEYIRSGNPPVVKLPLPRGPAGFKDLLNIELNAEYVIPATVIQSLSVTRDDMSIITRADLTWETVYGGQPLEGFTGHFTDAGFLLKYGLRTSGPQHNPMALSPKIAEVLSAVHLAAVNSTARTISLTVFNNREYQPGRLYYIPITIPTTSELDQKVVSRGVVGYLTKINTSLTHNGEAAHVLTLEHVRQAEVLAVPVAGNKRPMYYANFKKLPDIATYMRLLASDSKFSIDADKAIQSAGSSKQDALNSNTTGTFNGALCIENGTSLTELNPGLQHAPFSRQLRFTGMNANYLPDEGSLSLEGEKNNFVTTLSAAAFQNNAKVSISKDLLAKLTIYDADPLVKLYPTITAATDKVGAWGGSRSWNTRIPDTESLKNRDAVDLLRVVYGILLAAVEQKYISTRRFRTSDIPALDRVITAGDLMYIRTDPSEAGSQLPGVTGVKRSIFVGTRFGHIGYYSQVVFAFIQTEGNPRMDKFMVFHVPYTKSLRLANIINMGTPPGCGYRDIAKVKSASGNTKAKSDLHTNGAGIVFTNLDVAAWSFSDIIGAAVELDIGANSEINSMSLDLSEDNSDMYHLINSYINCQVEPFNYVRDYNRTYNPKAVVPMEQATANELLKWALASVPPSVLKMSFPEAKQTLGEANLSAKTYLKSWLKTAVGTRKERVLVPPHTNYFTTLFNALATQKQQVKGSELPTLYLSIMHEAAVQAQEKAPNKLIVTPAGRYLLRNAAAFTSVSLANVDKFSFAIDSNNYPLLSSGRYSSLWNYIRGMSPGYKMLCFQMVNNTALTAPADKIVQAFRLRMQGVALSNIWHTSYAQSKDPFQTQEPEGSRSDTDMFHKLNLKGLVR